MSLFKNRSHAGKQLAEKIFNHQEIKASSQEVVVLAVPRGGLVVGKEVAAKLNAPLDVVVVQKISVPENQELAIGAIGETKGSVDINKRIVEELKIDDEYIEKEVKAKKQQINKKEKIFREGKQPLSLKNKTVVVVDDGAATGETMMAAVREVWNNDPQKVIAALPVLSKETLDEIDDVVDEVIFLEAKDLFFAVGQFYEDFSEVSDKEAVNVLKDYKNGK
jgi:putative phosphoribosyl transferase